VPDQIGQVPLRPTSQRTEAQGHADSAQQSDLFDERLVASAVSGHDCVVHLATHIPLGTRAARANHTLGRSQRISSNAFTVATGCSATTNASHQWAQIR